MWPFSFRRNPEPWEPRDRRPVNWAQLLWKNPPIVHAWPSTGLPLGAVSTLGPALRERAATFLITTAWTIESGDGAHRLLEAMRSYRASHERHQFVFLGNTERETNMIADGGFEAITINQNCLLNDELFSPLPHVSPEFDAIYTARLSRDKRLELAARVDRLALVYFRNAFEHTVAEFHAEQRRLQRLMPQATFINRLNSNGCEWLSPESVNRVLARSRVGLCLSAEEGAMRASIEYLFAGLSVVSTPSLGGRDVYFDPEFCEIVDPDPENVRAAVADLVARSVPRNHVRQATLRRVKADRQRYIALVQRLIDRAGGSGDFATRFHQLLRGEGIMTIRSMKEFGSLVRRRLHDVAGS